MNLPAAFLVVRWLVWDTFRQALASRIFWVMLGVSGLCILFCLSTSTVDLPTKPINDSAERIPGTDPLGKQREAARAAGVDPIQGELTFLFGAIRVEWQQYREDAIRWLQLVLAGGIADTVGLLLALIWTAAFLPTFLDPSAISVLLAKPIPRWSLLAGKYVGVLVFVTLQALVFVVGTWIALGIRSGVWSPQYLLCVPILVFHFAIFFSFSAFLAVWTRSTISCVVGSLFFWLLCWGMNFGRHAALAHLAEQGTVAQNYSRVLEFGYWFLPKPTDVGYVLAKALDAEKYFPLSSELRAVEKMGVLSPEMSLLASVAFAIVMLGIAGYEFVKAEY